MLGIRVSKLLPRLNVRSCENIRDRAWFCSSSQPGKFAVVSLYHLDKIDKVEDVVRDVRTWLEEVGATGRVYFNRQGVNCQMCLRSDKLETFKDVLGNNLGLDNIKAKVHFADFNVYRKLRVRHGKLLENLNDNSDISLRGEHLDRTEWNKVLEEEPDSLILDIRNGYEWDVGRFKGAERPRYRKFSEFGEMADDVVERVKDKKQKVLMYCTGGIRCEVFSSLLIKRGLKEVYQLKDGVLGYGEGSVEDTRHWEGNLFVFDDRLVVPIDGSIGGEKDKPVSICRHCGVIADMVYNCNSLQCNQVHISCMQCAVTMKGCCSPECRDMTAHHFVARNSRQWPKGVKGGKMIGRGELYREWVSSMSHCE